MNAKTITIKEYLSRSGISFRESGSELITKCFFNSCDDNSNKARLYFKSETGEYFCQKCNTKGNLFTLVKHFGDNIQDILLNEGQDDQNAPQSRNNANAQKIWETISEAPANFAYLTRKKISSHGARLYGGNLVLPLYAGNGSLSSLQFINKEGDKKFLTGGKVAGCFFLIGQPSEKICITEGFATAASIHQATGYAVAIAFSAGNLKAVAEIIKEKYSNVEIIVCADADNTGFTKAKEVVEVIGGKLAIPKFEPTEKVNDGSPSDFNDLHVLRDLNEVKAIIESAEIIPQKFGFTPLSALLNEPEEEINWIVENLLPSGGFSIVVAKPKIGKSTFARQVALNVARGEDCIGRKTIKGCVLYISLEEKRSEVKNHFKLMGATGVEDLGVYVGDVPEEAHKWLEREVERKRPVLVIVDTLFRFAHVNDVNDYTSILSALNPLLTLARNKSAHLMCIHHARKAGGDGADTTLGSTAIFGSVDTAIVLKKSDGKRTIETQQRYGTDLEPTVMIFDVDSKTISLGGSKEEEDTKKIATEILEFLKMNKDPVGEPVIEEEVEGRTTLKRKALRMLVITGEVMRSGSGKRGDPFMYSCSLVPTIYTEQEKREAEKNEDVSQITKEERI